MRRLGGTLAALTVILSTSLVLGVTPARADGLYPAEVLTRFGTYVSSNLGTDAVMSETGVGLKVATRAGIGEAAGGAAGGVAGVLAVPAFELGYQLGNKVIGPALFKWAFGDQGDARSRLYNSPQTAMQWQQDAFSYSAPPAPALMSDWYYGDQYRREHWLKNYSASDRAVAYTIRCTDDSSIGTHFDSVIDAAIVTPGQWFRVEPSCQANTHLERVTVAVDSVVAYDWSYSPTAPWSAHVEVQCRDGAGNVATAIGATVNFTPGPGTAPPLTVPVTCPSILPGSHPEILTVKGGRTDDNPDELLIGVPVPQWDPHDPGPEPTTQPSTQASTQPSPNPSATLGVGVPIDGLNPDPDSGPVPSPTVDPKTGGKSCMGAVWSWNPVQWVFVPVKCALIWAFVDPNLGQTWADFRGDVGGAAPWSFILAGPDFLTNIVAGFQHPSTCGGSHVTPGSLGLPLDDLQPWCALDSSDGSGAFTVGMMRNVATAGIWIAFLWACYHRAKRLVGDSGPNDPGGDHGDDAGYQEYLIDKAEAGL
jgi:hypothetical protein